MLYSHPEKWYIDAKGKGARMRRQLLTNRRLLAAMEWFARCVVFAALGYAGLLKLNWPYATAEFLDAVLQVHSTALVRMLGMAEVALALSVISGAASLWAGRATIALFTAFAMTHALAAAGPDKAPPCGCLGTSEFTDSIPTIAWIAGNLSLALLGGVIAWRAERPSDPNRSEVCVG